MKLVWTKKDNGGIETHSAEIRKDLHIVIDKLYHGTYAIFTHGKHDIRIALHAFNIKTLEQAKRIANIYAEQF